MQFINLIEKRLNRKDETMKYSNRTIRRLFLLISWFFLVVTNAPAQQWVVDEIDEESHNGPFSGIIGAILLLGLIWLLGSVFGKGKKEREKEREKGQSLNNDSTNRSDLHNIIDDTDVHSMVDGLFTDNPISSTRDTSTELKRTSTPAPAKNDDNGISDRIFEKKCIEIYGEYAENTYGLVLIKEDGEYRQISYPDQRYMILSTYIFQNHKERHAAICSIGNGELLKYYIEYVKDCKVFPEAKPMESHGRLEKEYYGERIAMMMAYYDESSRRFPVYSNHAHSLKDFCLSLGWDLAIYIHQYIGQPMDLQAYYDLKDMQLRKMSIEEYLEYKKNRTGQIINKGKEGFFDECGNRIGNTYEEARAFMRSKEVITFEQAIEEIKAFEWKL